MPRLSNEQVKLTDLCGPLKQLCDVGLLEASVSSEELEAVAVEGHVRGCEHDGPVVATCQGKCGSLSSQVYMHC